MKILIAVLALLLGVAAYVTLTAKDVKDDVPAGQVQSQVPIWQQPIPEGTKLVESGLAKINVKPVRRNEGDRYWMEFHVTEEHGYMVDGITVQFWYRFKDAESGDMIDDPHKVGYFVKGRLGFNETLVESTPLLDLEFEHLGRERLEASTGANWGTKVIKYSRAMEPDRK
jgi:hypothetical protein